jgi:5-formyltetrahydrofolate cyclo-ligase
MTMEEEKRRLRLRLAAVAATPGQSAAIARRVAAADWWAAAFGVGLYRSAKGEPATDGLLADALRRGARTAVPVAAGGGYRWGAVDAGTRWVRGRFGILEPSESATIAADELRVALVPGAAFDAQGGRLGRGGGHFDRLLSQFGGLLVGLCVEARRVEAVPMQAHDVRMDVVATEKRFWFAPTAAGKLDRLLGADVAYARKDRGR